MEIINSNNHGKKKRNPFSGHIKRLLEDRKKINPVFEVVNLYYEVNDIAHKHRAFYEGRYGYPKLAKEAKKLIEVCGGDVEDAMWCIDRMKYVAEKKGMDWSISTCLKYPIKE